MGRIGFTSLSRRISWIMLDFSKDGKTEFFGWLPVVCLLGFLFVLVLPFFSPQEDIFRRS